MQPILLWSCFFAGTGNPRFEDAKKSIKMWEERSSLAQNSGVKVTKPFRFTSA